MSRFQARSMYRWALLSGLVVMSLSSSFAPAEEEGLGKRFKAADKNSDGKVTLSEFKTVAENPKRADKLFQRLDQNSDGSVTRSELKAAAQMMAAAKGQNGDSKKAKVETEKAGNESDASQVELSAKKKKKEKASSAEPTPAESTSSAAQAKDQRNSIRDPLAVAMRIDEQVDRELLKNKIPASPLATDAEFIRRLSLDLRGRIPELSEVENFLKETRGDKRRKLIDEYLADDEYGEHFAIIWYHRIAKPDDDNQRALQKNDLQPWLASAFNQNRGWDGIVKDLLTASGDREQNPATTFWLTAIGDAKLGQPEPAKATAAASRLFMGVRLECCECHNHPFTPLKQTDFWGTAAFFAQTHARDANQQAAKANATPKVFENADFSPKRKKKAEAAEQTKPAPFGSVAIPYEEGQTVDVKFLGGSSPNLEGLRQLRPLFAEWLTAPDNPYFARAAVNKLWANFFGRGIVDPIDDMQTESTNTHPELLTLLANEFVAAEFDQKHLIRCLCNSQTYQRSSQPTPENRSDETLYSKMPLKIMTADMLYDSLRTALGHQVAESGRREKGTGKKQQGSPRAEFRKFFHADADDDAGIVADYTHGVPQVLRLMNAKQINDTSSTVSKLLQTESQPGRVISRLYLTVLSREPTPVEVAQVQKFIETERDKANAYGDLMWALLNSSEFLFNH